MRSEREISAALLRDLSHARLVLAAVLELLERLNAATKLSIGDFAVRQVRRGPGRPDRLRESVELLRAAGWLSRNSKFDTESQVGKWWRGL